MNLKNIFISLALFIPVVIFTIQNTKVITIKFFFWEFPISWVLLIFILLAVGLIAVWFLRAGLKKNEVETWYKKYNIHTVLAASITAIAVIIAGGGIANKISNAKLLKSIIPEMISKNKMERRAAMYIIKEGISEDVMIDFAVWMGNGFAKEILGDLKKGDFQAANKVMKTSNYIASVVFDNVRNSLEQDKNSEGINEDLKKSINELLLCNKVVTQTTAATSSHTLVDDPNCKIDTPQMEIH